VRFDLKQPRDLQEAASLLSSYGEDARIIAGGQSLLLMIRAGLLRPALIVSVGGIGGLSGITETAAGKLRIGALTTHRQILASPLIREKAPLLIDAVALIGSTPVRNFGTIGGNLCHNEMGSDPPTALLALDASVECCSTRDRRSLPLSSLLSGYFETSLVPDEILTAIEIPALPSDTRSVYLKYTQRPGDLAIVGVAVLLDLANGVCREARIALGGVGPVPFRAAEAEKLLCGNAPDSALIAQVAMAASLMADPLSDAHASAEYRRKMVRVFVQRAVEQTIGRRGEDR
jgi:aerobic carbon-monoxide dehydrogenase medium subunit